MLNLKLAQAVHLALLENETVIRAEVIRTRYESEFLGLLGDYSPVFEDPSMSGEILLGDPSFDGTGLSLALRCWPVYGTARGGADKIRGLGYFLAELHLDAVRTQVILQVLEDYLDCLKSLEQTRARKAACDELSALKQLCNSTAWLSRIDTLTAGITSICSEESFSEKLYRDLNTAVSWEISTTALSDFSLPGTLRLPEQLLLPQLVRLSLKDLFLNPELPESRISTLLYDLLEDSSLFPEAETMPWLYISYPEVSDLLICWEFIKKPEPESVAWYELKEDAASFAGRILMAKTSLSRNWTALISAWNHSQSARKELDLLRLKTDSAWSIASRINSYGKFLEMQDDLIQARLRLIDDNYETYRNYYRLLGSMGLLKGMFREN